MLIIIQVSFMNFILPEKNDLIENSRKLISCTYICSVGQRFVEFPVEIDHFLIPFIHTNHKKAVFLKVLHCYKKHIGLAKDI